MLELTPLGLHCVSITKSQCTHWGPESVNFQFEHTLEHPMCSNEFVQLLKYFHYIGDEKLPLVEKIYNKKIRRVGM